MNKFVALMHRYCFDYTNAQNFAVCDEVMVPGYTLHMGAHSLSGRDEQYKPATRKQFEQFPGLCLTVNGIVTNDQRLVLHFSEHGASTRHNGARAAWSGIGLYKWDGGRLTENFVEQDYYSRRQQLSTGKAKPVETPAIAPWDTQAQPSNPSAESVLSAVLETGDLSAITALVFDDEWAGSARQRILQPTSTQIDDIFSAGDQVAFRATQSGRLLEDFTHGDASLEGREVLLYMTGLVTVRGGEVVSGRVIRDRLGLQRRLRG